MKHICLAAVLCWIVAPSCLLAIDPEDGVMSAPTPGSAPRLIDPGDTDLKPAKKNTNVDLPNVSGDANYAKALARDYGVTPQQVSALREQHMTWIDIESTLEIARHIVTTAKSPTTMDDALRQVQKLRGQGSQYDDIAQKFGGSLSEFKSEGVRHATSGDAGSSFSQPSRPEKPDRTPARPDRPDVPEKPQTP